jgi:type VI secretion system protein ImpJ
MTTITMMAGARGLSRVHWRLGQALLPEHFERQELGLSRELALRIGQLAPAAWGVAQLAWDRDALADGIVRIPRLMAILPRGQLIDVPGNAQIAPLDLASASQRTVALYAHLLGEPAYEAMDARASELEAVELIVHRLELSFAPGHPGARDSLQLAKLAQSPDGQWTVRDDHVPPLVALTAWPTWFARVVVRMRAILADWQDILLGDFESHVLSIAKNLRAHEAMRRVRGLTWFLTQIDAEAPARTAAGHADNVAAAHPFALFEHLVELYLDVHSYQMPANSEPSLAGHVYDHRDIAGSFAPLLDELEQRTHQPHGRAPYARFTRDGRIASVALPPNLDGVRLYWLVRRGGGIARDALRTVKLAAPSRLEAVHRHALRGIAAKPLASAPFRHDFDPDVDFYELTTDGEEWQHTFRERQIAYVAEGAIAGCETYIFWRAG